jgi:hypothetical protein
MFIVLLVICAVVALVTGNVYWWIGVAVFFGLHKFGTWITYKSTAWRRMHYPLLKRYSFLAGIHGGLHPEQVKEQPFDIVPPLSQLIREVRPSWDDDKIKTFISNQFKRCRNFEDAENWRGHLLSNNPSRTAASLEEQLQAIRGESEPTDNGFMVRFVIAGLVEEQHGTAERMKYLAAIVTRKV